MLVLLLVAIVALLEKNLEKKVDINRKTEFSSQKQEH